MEQSLVNSRGEISIAKRIELLNFLSENFWNLYIFNGIDTADQIGRLFRDHDSRGTRVAARNFRHDRSVDHSETFDADDPARKPQENEATGRALAEQYSVQED